MRLLVVIAALLLIGGCAGSVRELAAFQDLTARGAWSEIASRPLDCAPAAEGCGRTREIKGDACLRLAQTALAEARAAQAAPYAACAVDNYGAALAAAGADAASLTPRRLEARRLARESATDLGAAGDANAALADAAAAFAAAAPARPEGFHYAADARLWRAVFTDGDDACGDIGQARALAARAAAATETTSPLPGGLREPTAALARRAEELAAAKGCAA
jgi:hypothetical protein